MFFQTFRLSVFTDFRTSPNKFTFKKLYGSIIIEVKTIFRAIKPAYINKEK